MPFCDVAINLAKEKIPPGFHIKLAKALSEILNKPIDVGKHCIFILNSNFLFIKKSKTISDSILLIISIILGLNLIQGISCKIWIFKNKEIMDCSV